MKNKEELIRLLRAGKFNQWRWKNLTAEIDLSDADLSGADLSGANLSWANLRRAKLRRADLSGAILIGADLSSADLSGANFFEARGLAPKFQKYIIAELRRGWQ